MYNPFRVKAAKTADSDAERGIRSASSSFSFGGIPYALTQPSLASAGAVERPSQYGDLAYALRSNSALFSVCDVRSKALGEAHFQWRRREQGRPSGFFGSPELLRLERPWPGAHTRDLVARMVQDIDLAGNAYVVRSGPFGVARLRPDWMLVVIASDTGDPNAPDATVAGYQYHPGGIGTASEDRIASYLPEEVGHWMPTPDPAARHRGLSWIATALCEVAADAEVTDFKARYFKNGATPSSVLTMPDGVKGEQFDEAVNKFTAAHGSAEHASSTLFLRYGADYRVVGSNAVDAAMKELQGAGETRIAAAAGVPPVIAGFSEGLSSTSYAAYDAARRRFADYTLTPLMNGLAEALETLLDVPAGAYLAADPRDIPHFQEDVKDQAEIRKANAGTLRTLLDAGFEATSAVAAVDADDLSLLTHTGRLSVQLQQAPAAADEDPAPVPTAPVEETADAA